MTYSFDIDVAKEYGVNAAIMIKNFQFWIMKHRAEEKNFYDGRYWTYNSVRGWTELFCFWTPNQIRTILDSLVEKGVLKRGNYNPTPYDRTLWYAFVDEEKWIGSKSQIDLGNFTNGFVENHQPIPDIKPDIKPEDKEMLKESGALPPSRPSLTAYYDKFYDWWNDKLRLKESELESPGHIKRFTAKSPERQRAFNQRWKETKTFLKQKGQNPTNDEIFDYMTKNVIGFNYINSPWLQGRITSDKYETPFEFNVDFVLRPSTWTKLLENYYVDKKFNIGD